MEIGGKLRAVIEKNYPSGKAYATKTGINYTQLSQYLNNTKKPSIAFLSTFLNEFTDVDLNWLFRSSENAESIANEDPEKYAKPISNLDRIERIEYLLLELKKNMSQK